MTSQAYRNAIGEEMKRTGLDTIDKATRSYLLKIMDNLSDAEAWLAERPNPDRLSHPKTIWKAFDADMNRPWPSPGVEDPGGDPEDQEEYWGHDGDSDPEQERRAEPEPKQDHAEQDDDSDPKPKQLAEQDDDTNTKQEHQRGKVFWNGVEYDDDTFAAELKRRAKKPNPDRA